MLKGRRIIPLMSLNRPSITTPTKRNGRAMSQIRGNKTKISKATGQEKTSKRHQRITAIKNLIKRTRLFLLSQKYANKINA
jgi:hypothetical protein